VPPLAIALRLSRYNRSSLASVLAVLQAELPPDLVSTRLVASPDEISEHDGLVLYSFMSAQATGVASELSSLQARLGAVPTLAGGAHPSGDPEGTLGIGFRWVAPGEAGPTLAALVQAVARGVPPEPGVLARGEAQPLDRYRPWPEDGQLFCAVEVTRGCPLGCAFCQTPALHGRRPRHRSLEALERVLAHGVATGHSFTRFIAPNAFAFGGNDGRRGDPRQLELLLRSARRVGMRRIFLGSFPSEVRPESVTPELLGLVRDLCDNRSIVIGLQSGSDAVLRRLRRGHTVEEGVRAVELCARAGLRPRVDFIFGLPGESAEDRRLTRDLIRQLATEENARINTHVFSPLPGTPLAGAPPGRIDAETRELVEWLIGRGQANGISSFERRAPVDLVQT
jgi:B12-binding domain/radical SAM domain protein